MRFRTAPLRPVALAWTLGLLTAVLGCGGATSGSAAPAPEAKRSAPSAPVEPQAASSSAAGASTSSAAVVALPQDAARTPAVSAAPAEPTPRPPLPQGTKILHVGDSFAGALGLPLAKLLEAEGVHSILKHTDASYLTTWAWDNELRDYIWKFNPDLVVVTLGANELAIALPQQRERAIKKIVATIGDRPCVWVAIPLWNGPQNGLLEVIRSSAAPCHYLDTNQLMDTAHMARIHDGIHPTQAAREAWAEVVLDWLAREREPNGRVPWSLRPPASTP